MPDREERRRLGLTNGDDPKAIHFEVIQKAVKSLLSGIAVPNIVYDHTSGRHKTIGTIEPSDTIIIDGASSLYKELVFPDTPTMGIFLDADSDDTRITLRNQVNIIERGYTPAQSNTSMRGYLEAYHKFIAPTKQWEDIVFVVDKDRRFRSTHITDCTCRPIRE